MAGVTYKCPSCGAYLTFNADTQRWHCDFCNAEFDEKTLLDKGEAYQQEAEQEAAEHAATGGEVIYHCPSCGSEIMTDETTVATHCYYCHNPVVLQGKLTDSMKPDEVLPFSIGKEKAVEKFMAWVKHKRFVPSGFFTKNEVNQMTGVYYPHFVVQCEVEGVYQGEGLDVSIADTPRYVVTTTSHYAVNRRADITFRNIMRPALKSQNRKLSDGIHPFPLEKAEPFSSAYLSGFLAERRDLSAKEATGDVPAELSGYVKPMLEAGIQHESCSGSATCTVNSLKSQYVLLPTWVLTYPQKQSKEPYYYAMNGCTGEVCGKLPIAKGKLLGFCALIAAAVCALMCVAGYFLY